MSNIILLSISGVDRIGLSADFYAVVGQLDVRILDIGQSVIHDQVSLGMMLQLPLDQDLDQLTELITNRAQNLALQVKVSNVDEQQYAHWVKQQGADRYILTLLTREVAAEEIARITKVTAEQGLNIHDIVRLSGRVPLDKPISNDIKSCIQFSLQGQPKDPAIMRSNF